MAADVNDITINYEEDGQQLVKELDKVILSKGAWATVLFRYQQWDARKKAFSPDRFTIRRYRKIQGEYMQQSKFNISSTEQAGKIIAALTKWVGSA